MAKPTTTKSWNSVLGVWQPAFTTTKAGWLPVCPSQRRRSAWKTAGLVTSGVGVVGLGIGSYFGIDAISKNSSSSAGCNGNTCTADGAALRNDARSAGDKATVFVVAGSGLAIAGAIMFLVAPRANAARNAGVVLLPTFGKGAAGLFLQGAM